MIETTAAGTFDRGPGRALNAIGHVVGKEFVVKGESPFGKGKVINMRKRKEDQYDQGISN